MFRGSKTSLNFVRLNLESKGKKKIIKIAPVAAEIELFQSKIRAQNSTKCAFCAVLCSDFGLKRLYLGRCSADFDIFFFCFDSKFNMTKFKIILEFLNAF